MQSTMPLTARRLCLAFTTAALLSVAGLATGLSRPAGAEAATAADPVEDAQTLTGSYLAARMARSDRDLSNAAGFYQKALESDPDNLHLLEQAFSLTLANGDLETAFRYAEQLIEKDRLNRFARLALGVKALKERSYSGATGQFAKALEGVPSELTATLLTAWSKVGAKKTEEALRLIDDLKGPEWQKIFKTFHGGLIAELAGLKDSARTRLSTAYELDGGALRIVEAQARNLVRAGDLDGARQVLLQYDNANPDDPMIRKALKSLDEGLVPPPLVKTAQEGAAEVLYGIGSAIGRDRADEWAAIYLQLALHLDPKADRARIALGSLYQQLGKPEKAIEVFSKVQPDSPLKRVAEIQVGLNYNQLDKLDEARAHLRAIVDADPSDLEAVRALGSVLRVHQKFEEAAEVYSLGIDTITEPSGSHWWLYYVRGISYERTKRWELAEADFLKALELEPEQPLVLNYLGYSWVDMGINLDRALDMIIEAVDRRPTDGYIVDSLGWAYYRLGQYDKAVEQLERAVELKPEDPVINDHLGDAYWKVGRRLEATFQWSHARDLEPEEEELAKILRKLEYGLDAPAPERAHVQGEVGNTVAE